MTEVRASPDAKATARAMLANPPPWVGGLMGLRNAIVAPFGLKTGRETRDHADHLERIGIFPIQSATPERAVLGFEDRHLDFRVVVDVRQAGGDSEVTATTLVLWHNLLGHAYLTAILPFHRLIVRASLERVATI